MFITNDPFTGGGTHLPDIAVAAPVFFDGEIIAFVANIAHHSDVGGRVPGSNSGDCTSIYEEGLRIPLVKVIKRGEVCNDVLSFIMLNCRTPEERLADLQAHFASIRIGTLRMQELAASLSKDFLIAACNDLLEYAERRIKEGISRIPDGVYSFEDYLDDDGRGTVRIPIRVTITIEGEDIHVDFTGSSPQVRGGVNVVWTALQAMVYYALKTIIDPSIPPNGGYFDAIQITAPPGSITNALPPAAIAGRVDALQIIGDIIFGALSAAVPERVMAGCNAAATASMFAGYDSERGKPYVYLETHGGGMGARYNRDGLDGVHVHGTNSSNLPAEALENEYPLMVDRIELIENSGGRGKFRGGLGIRKDIRIVNHVCSFSTHGDRQHFPPWGLFGGESGRCGRFIITRASTGKAEVLPSSKVSEILLEDGDVVSIETPGAGGWGPVAARPLHLLEKDLRERKVNAAWAAR
jgi:N-methylhydantoinase B